MEQIQSTFNDIFYNLFFAVATLACIFLLLGIGLTYFAPAALSRFHRLIWSGGIICGLAAIVCDILIMWGWQQ